MNINLLHPVTERPYIGQLVEFRNLIAKIIAIRPAGTVDVETLEPTPRYFRLSGLPFTY